MQVPREQRSLVMTIQNKSADRKIRATQSKKQSPSNSEGLNADCEILAASSLPSPRLQHVFLLDAADGKSLHRRRHIFADFE